MLATLALAQALVTPYAKNEPLRITLPTLPASAERFEPIELRIPFRARFDNPFDPNDVSLEASISGLGKAVPAYFDGEEGWKIRFAPAVEGTLQIVLTGKDRTGVVKSAPGSLSVIAGDNSGFVRLSGEDRRYFATDTGASFWPLGANVCWQNGKALNEFENWLPKYAAQGVNLIRIWLSPEWVTFALEGKGNPAEGKGLGQFDLSACKRLDELLKKADALGVRVMLCIDSYNILRDKDGYPFWEQTPHNQDHGGPLRIWSDFWTSPQMDRLYRQKLRYLVARYSAYPSVFAWEFWNEVDLTRDFNSEIVREWHRKMSTYLRSIDPFNHLITTSQANTNGDRTIDLIPELDFFQTHHYGDTDPAGTVVTQQSRKGSWGGKAHFFGEIGADAAGPRGKDDPHGLQIHDPIWASIATGASGAAMPWWWYSYIDPLNLYPIFGAAHRFLVGVNWPKEGFRQAKPTVTYRVKPARPEYRDLVISGGPVSWEPSEANQPQRVTLGGEKFVGDTPLSGILHGVSNHPNLHNPVRFAVKLPRATRFEVQVGDVSGYGGAGLRIAVDGEALLTRMFPDPDGSAKGDTLTKYAAAYGLTVPAGSHVITVENIGADWLTVSYRFVNLLTRRSPPLNLWAVVGNRSVLGWARVEGQTWRNICALRRTIPPCPATILRLPGLSAGRWRIEFWDTWKGRITRATSATVGLDGTVRVELPAVSVDLGIKGIRIG